MKIANRPTPPPLVNLKVDEGAHPKAKTEWWYMHGYLKDEQNRSYGFMQTLFDAPDVIDARYNVDMPGMPGAGMLDLSLTEETAGKQHVHREMKIFPPFWKHGGIREGDLDEAYKSSRGLWKLRRMDSQSFLIKGPGAKGEMELKMTPTKPALMMGGQGEIKMGPYGLSKYYTFPRMQLEGTLEIDGEKRKVTGSGWMDHQWGDMSMFKGYQGWDWFGIQLDNNTEINAFHFRGENHSTAHATVGISHADGSQSVTESLKLQPGRTWKSPETGVTYPVEWHLSLPEKGVELDLKPSVDAQEMVGHPPYSHPELAPKPTYWEGSMEVNGTVKGQPVHGRAYMELTGYAGPSALGRQEATLLAQQLSEQTERDGQPFGGNTPDA
jgi:predicted secreted hydrolase